MIGKRSSRPRGGLALRVRGDLLPFDGDGGATLSLVQDGSYHYYHPPKALHFAPDRCLRWKWTKKYIFYANHQFQRGLIRSFSGVLIVFVSCIKILVIGQMLSNHSTPLFWCRIKTRLTSRIHKREVYTAIYWVLPGINEKWPGPVFARLLQAMTQTTFSLVWDYETLDLNLHRPRSTRKFQKSNSSIGCSPVPNSFENIIIIKSSRRIMGKTW